MGAVAIAGVAGGGIAGERLPIFDTHVHYSQGAWDAFSPRKALDALEAAGVERALVSSSPDHGTIKLHRAAPDRIVPILRPYRGEVRSSNWIDDPKLIDYLEARLKLGVHKGIGEFHLFDLPGSTATPQVRQMAKLAAARSLFLHIHSGPGPVEAMFRIEPKSKILWAHAGFTTPPAEVGALVERYRNLWVEMSFRAHSIMPGERIDPAWRDLFLSHPDRFMVGTDTYVSDRWAVYIGLVDEHRAWLEQLPREVAEKIAYRNAERLFGK